MKLAIISLTATLLLSQSAAFTPRADGTTSIGSVYASSSSNKPPSKTALNMALDDPTAFAKDLIDGNDVMVR